ncbi:MAG: UDP-N-acetylglucosamine diphosphorylase / glucose-phosphate thymidylyltransferase [Methanolobus sp.]|jgi:glucose-1-phosphate thymidylyltransferase|uniref:bifunctional sugar-1-phosphate nucleotidylyltransferase/acetyltransferase n=1 Tax=Methanolobus sp. TaxID=1874737 RepID=UPI0025907563|nr:bifunctional sugar-1-phosphate nucleotidylyltransferase/acetyltransferase [Methanolobus sp.]MDK2830665.1 UDP-N-acetylglucosamine diphosphorylase / glucose-phosphate thymidylyltransferase [Methanolobus sp.]
MKAVILAAGEGKRCRPLTLTRSKVMLPVANKPILEHIINALVKNDIKEIILVVGYKKERIMDYFEDGINFGVKIEYVEQKAQIGTAHAILQARNLIGNEEKFVVVNGDNIIGPDAIADLINGEEGDATLLTCKKDNVSGYGVIVAKGKNVIEIIEKPKTLISHLINTGIYLFKKDIFEMIERTAVSTTGEYAITDTLQMMIDEGIPVTTAITNAEWLDAAYSWNLLEANTIILGDFETDLSKAKIEDCVSIKGSVSVGRNTTIRAGSYIVGPVVIGDNCDIGPNVVILPSTSVGNNVSIASFSYIKNSILMNDTRVSTHSNISNSVVGSNVTTGPNFITEEGEELHIILGNELHEAEKLGTVIGDDTDIGGNVLVHAGKMVSSNCRISSGKTISEDVPTNALLK